MPVLRLVLIGLAAGIFSALFGVGGGIIVVPLLVALVHLAPRDATVVSLGAIVITAVAGAARYAFEGEVDVAYAALVGGPAVLGAVVGVSLQQRVSGRWLTLAFAVFAGSVGVWLIVG